MMTEHSDFRGSDFVDTRREDMDASRREAPNILRELRRNKAADKRDSCMNISSM